MSDNNSTTPPSAEGIMISFVFWCAVSSGLLLVYLLVLRPCFPRFVLLRHVPFTQKLRTLQKEDSALNSSRCCGQTRKRLKRLLIDPFRVALFMEEHDFIHQCGLDGYVTVRTLWFGLRVLLVLSILNVVVLTPTYRYQIRSPSCDEYCAITQTEEDAYQAECVCSWIDQCSMANIPLGSSMLWFPAVFMLVTTMLVLGQVAREYEQIVRIRREYWKSHCPNRLHTVFVEYKLPQHPNDSLVRTAPLPPSNQHQEQHHSKHVRSIQDYFERLFPQGEIHRIELLSSPSSKVIERLGGVGHDRVRILMRLERALAIQAEEARAPTRWKCVMPCMGGKPSVHNADLQVPNDKHNKSCFGQRVDAIHFYSSRLQELNTHFQQLKRELASSELKAPLNPEKQNYQYAFVTFRDIQTAAQASQTLICNNIRVLSAPDPSDVRWGSILHKIERHDVVNVCRTLLSRTLYVLVLLFWGTITSFIGAVTSTEALGQLIPEFGQFLADHPVVFMWVDRLITLIYALIISLAYPIITWSVTLQTHRVADSHVEIAVLRRYFAFLVIQVFVFYSIAGSVFKSILDIAQSPAHLIDTLSSTIPKNASFFIGYMAVRTFDNMLDLTRVYSLLFELFRCIWYGRTITRREQKYQVCGCCWHFRFPNPMGMAGTNAGILLVFFIGISYSVIQPLVLFAALVYFLGATISHSFRLVHASKQVRDGGGRFWPYSFWCIIASLYTAQLTLIGTLLIKQGFAPAIFVAATSMVATFFISRQIHGKFSAISSKVNLDLAADLDERERASIASPLLPSSDSANRPAATASRDVQMIDVLCQPIMNYNHVLGAYDHDADLDEDDEEAQQRLRIENKQGIHVYRYLHPVLLERDELVPDATLIDWKQDASKEVFIACTTDQPVSSADNATSSQDENAQRLDDSSSGGATDEVTQA